MKRNFCFTTKHPRKALQLTEEEFLAQRKNLAKKTPSITPGQKGTSIWYAVKNKCIIEVKFSSISTRYMLYRRFHKKSFNISHLDSNLIKDL